MPRPMMSMTVGYGRGTGPARPAASAAALFDATSAVLAFETFLPNKANLKFSW